MLSKSTSTVIQSTEGNNLSGIRTKKAEAWARLQLITRNVCMYVCAQQQSVSSYSNASLNTKRATSFERFQC